MNGNDMLRLAYASFCIRTKGTRKRARFSELLGLPVTEAGRTPTLDKWLVDAESTNHRSCPLTVGRYARLAVTLHFALPKLEMSPDISDEDYFILNQTISGEPDEAYKLIDPIQRENGESNEQAN